MIATLRPSLRGKLLGVAQPIPLWDSSQISTSISHALVALNAPQLLLLPHFYAMALAAVRHYPSSQFWSAFLPVALASLQPRTSTLPIQPWRRLLAIETASLLPIAIGSGIATTLQDIWESILRAVPKKKTTHSKKRHRQLAGKALQDVTALNKCPGCGRQKRAHALCPYCVQSASMVGPSNRLLTFFSHPTILGNELETNA